MSKPSNDNSGNGSELEPGSTAASLRDFARRIAHDFNNTLGTIMGNLELVRMDLDPNHPASESVGEIGKATERAKNLVVELLTIAGAPPDSSASPSASAQASPAPAHGNGQHILYLDDEEPLVFLATNLFKRLGYRVTGFTHADKALAAFQADPMQYDLIVTDFNLPNSSGLEIASQLLAIRPELPVILASGEVSSTLTRQAQLAGIRHVVYKPNTVDDLCRVIHHLASGM